MSEWKEYKLGDLVHIKHGWAFKGEFFADDGDLMIVTPGNFIEEGGFRVRDGKEKFYTGDFAKEFLLKKDDLIIAMTEQSAGLLGSPALIPKDNRFLHNQRIGLFQNFKKEKISKKYMYYLFFTQHVRGMIAGSATGTKVKHTAPQRIYNIKVKLPSLQVQKKIEKILSNYDNLIENNLKRIKLLEESARVTYEEWFLRFRVDGEKLEIDSETGLPFGWEKKKAIEVLNVKIGKTPPRGETQWFTKNNKGVKWISIKDMKQSSTYVFNSSEEITSEGVSKHNMNLAKTGTVLLSFKLTVGEVRITTEDMVTNEAIAHMNIKKDSTLFKEYIFLYLKSFNFDTLGSTSSIGTAINSQIVKAMPIIVPVTRTLEQFKKVVQPIFHEINNLQTQNQLLKEARDILLPRLMTGMIDVEDLEVAV